MSKEIKIAKIVNDFTFVITGGTDNGICEGDELMIVQPGKLEINDPDTGEVIGNLELKKGIIIAHEVFTNFSICRSETYEDEIATNSLAAFASNLSGAGTKWVTRYKKLNVNEDEITGGLVSDPISVGDIVKKINT